MFFYGGVLLTSIYNDKQDTHAGYRHDNYIGELNWPAAGGLLGGGAFATRHVSIACELGFRDAISTEVSVESFGHSERSVLSGLYTSRERLVSFVMRYDLSPRGRVDFQPLGGLTVSSATQTLTEQRGFYIYDTPSPISRRDTSLNATKIGLVGGANVAVRLAGGIAIVAAPRFHWIRRDEVTEYEHVVPYAGRVITAIAFGVEWRPLVKR